MLPSANSAQTRTFPLSGKFTPESQAIYDIVLKMQNDTMAALKADVLWDDVHVLAHKVAIDGLLSLGILKGDKDEILKARTSVAFFPHGLGHHLGMDTHDVGGNPNREDKDILFRYLRLRGKLPAGAVVTVEPGVSIFPAEVRVVVRDLLTRDRSTFATSSSSRILMTLCTANTLTSRCWTSTGTLAVSGELSYNADL